MGLIISFITAAITAAASRGVSDAVAPTVTATVTSFADDVASVFEDEQTGVVNVPLLIGATAVAAVAATLIFRKL